MAESKLEVQIKKKLDKPKFNRKKIEKLIKKLLIELQDNPDREGLLCTPERVARIYEEILVNSGLQG